MNFYEWENFRNKCDGLTGVNLYIYRAFPMRVLQKSPFIPLHTSFRLWVTMFDDKTVSTFGKSLKHTGRMDSQIHTQQQQKTERRCISFQLIKLFSSSYSSSLFFWIIILNGPICKNMFPEMFEFFCS